MTNLNNAQTTSAKFNPFHGVDFPITSVNLVTIINGLREQYNEKVVKLRHKNFLTKIDSFGFEMTGLNFQLSESKVSGQNVLLAESTQMTDLNFQVSESIKVNGLNFQLVESTYLDAKGESRKCYLIPKTECRALASTESNTICYKLMQYLDQLEAEHETLKKYLVHVESSCQKALGITPWRLVQMFVIPSRYPHLMRNPKIDHVQTILNALLEVLIHRGNLKAVPNRDYHYLPLKPDLMTPYPKSRNGFSFTKEGADKLLNNEPVWSAVHALIKDDLIYGRNADF